MGLFLIAILIGLPILEIAVFIRAGEAFGFWPTVGAIIATAVIGAALVRWQGISTLMKAQQAVAEHRFPVEEVFDGFCILFAGALLITPGFVTDTIGFLLLVPPLRTVFRRWVSRYLVASGRITVTATQHPANGPAQGVVIDGEFKEVQPGAQPPPANDDKPPPRLPSGRR